MGSYDLIRFIFFLNRPTVWGNLHGNSSFLQLNRKHGNDTFVFFICSNLLAIVNRREANCNLFKAITRAVLLHPTLLRCKRQLMFFFNIIANGNYTFSSGTDAYNTSLRLVYQTFGFLLPIWLEIQSYKIASFLDYSRGWTSNFCFALCASFAFKPPAS